MLPYRSLWLTQPRRAGAGAARFRSLPASRSARRRASLLEIGQLSNAVVRCYPYTLCRHLLSTSLRD